MLATDHNSDEIHTPPPLPDCMECLELMAAPTPELSRALDAAMEELEVLEEGAVPPSQLVDVINPSQERQPPQELLPESDYSRQLRENYATAAEEENVGYHLAEGGGFYYCRLCCRGLLLPQPTHWRLDHHTGEYACAGFDGVLGCGAVRRSVEWGLSCYSRSLMDNGAARAELARRAVAVVYKREYHWNERLSQRQATDPRVPRPVLRELEAWLTSGRGLSPAITYYQFAQLDRASLHAALRRLGYNVYCERWVQLKYRLVCGDPPEFDEEGIEVGSPRCEVPERWPHLWLSEDMLNAFRCYFRLVSDAFDSLLFKAGRKHTLKCNKLQSNQGPLARHNMYALRAPTDTNSLLGYITTT